MDRELPNTHSKGKCFHQNYESPDIRRSAKGTIKVPEIKQLSQSMVAKKKKRRLDQHVDHHNLPVNDLAARLSLKHEDHSIVTSSVDNDRKSRI